MKHIRVNIRVRLDERDLDRARERLRKATLERDAAVDAFRDVARRVREQQQPVRTGVLR